MHLSCICPNYVCDLYSVYCVLCSVCRVVTYPLPPADTPPSAVRRQPIQWLKTDGPGLVAEGGAVLWDRRHLLVETDVFGGGRYHIC